MLLAMSTNLMAQNNCLDFDGTNDYVAIGSNFGIGTNNLSVECWVYIPDNSEQGTFIKIGNAANGYGIGVGGTTFENPGNKLIYINELVGWHPTGNDIGTGWHHVAFTIDGSNSTNIYLDGINVYSFTETPITPSSVTYIGSTDASGGRLLTGGKIDEVRVWNDVRTETEIRQNMYRELPSPAGEANLVAYYKLNESDTTTTAVDSKGSNDGTLNNMSGNEWQTSPAMFGPKNCLDFDGTGDYVDCGSKTLTGSSITLECWVNVDVFQSVEPLISSLIGSESEGNAALLRLGDGEWVNNKAQFVLYFGSDQVKLDGTTELAANTWYHIAGVYSDGSGMKLYINGKLDASNDQSGSFTSNTNFYIASNDGTGRYLDGSIDEVRIWSDARTASEIREYMCKNIGCSESGLTAYYSCDYFTDSKLPDYNSGVNGTVYNDTSLVSSSAFNTWLNTNSLTWSTATNWSRGSVPGSADNVGISDYTGGTPPMLSATTVNNFVVDDSFTLDADATVNGNLIIEENLDLNGQTITLGADDGYLIEDAGLLNGTSGTITTTRSLNAPSGENVGGLGAEITTDSNLGSTTITRGVAAQAGYESHTGIKRYYIINPTTNTGLNATLVFHYDDSEVTGLTESQLVLYKSTNEGSTWTQIAADLDTNFNTLTATGLDGFSWWTAGDLEAPLLVDLVSFTATGFEDYVLLEWETASEIDNAGFYLWRSEKKSSKYEMITTLIPAKGSSTEGAEYSYEDFDVVSGLTYFYELEDVDYDGLSTFHGPVSATLGDDTILLLSPEDGALVSVFTPLTFEWKGAGLKRFKLEFSRSPDFTGKVIVLPRKTERLRGWITEESYTPSPKEWRRIRRLGRRGGMVYWAVFGEDEAGEGFVSENFGMTIDAPVK